MSLNPEHILIQAAGGGHDSWKTVSITASIKEAARSFTVTAAEQPGQWVFPPDSPVTIFANGELVLTGYVDKYNPSISATDHSVSITGRGKAADMIDSAAIHDKGYMENKTPDQIGKELDKFGVGIKAQDKLEKIPYFQIYQGESMFRAMDRALRDQGGHMMGKADGSVDIVTKAGKKRHVGGLIEGFNILQGSATLSGNNRFSDYIVKGQGRLGSDEKSLRVKEQAKDPGVKRYRPKLIINEGDTDKKRAKKRAETEKNRRAGESVKCSITTQGWRDEAGKLFEPNWLIYVHSPALKISGDMLIEKITFKQDSEGGGSTAQLDLVDPRAYGGKAAGKSKSDGAWTKM